MDQQNTVWAIGRLSGLGVLAMRDVIASSLLQGEQLPDKTDLNTTGGLCLHWELSLNDWQNEFPSVVLKARGCAN